MIKLLGIIFTGIALLLLITAIFWMSKISLFIAFIAVLVSVFFSYIGKVLMKI